MMKLKVNYTILAIETSLDDTCAAVTCDNRVLANVVASQVKFHEEWGGTVPHIAKRMHLKWIEPTVEEALIRSKMPSLRESPPGHSRSGIDAVAVTYGPGLAPSLEVGILRAKELVKKWNKPLIAVNHMEGHLLSAYANNSRGKGGLCLNQPPQTPPYKGGEKDKYPVAIFPALGFLISGGHTQLVLMKDMGDYQLLGETLDDAAGEAYDKVARMLKLGYPGGPILSELAKKGKPKYDLPEPMKHRQDLNFSFSGLKTASLYKLRELGYIDSGPHQRRASGVEMTKEFSRDFVADFAASFQQAVLSMLMRRFRKAIELYDPRMVLLGGGVISNVEIRKATRKVAREYGLKTYIPYSKKLFTDNAAMIGVTAWYQAKRGDFVEDVDRLDRKPNLSF